MGREYVRHLTRISSEFYPDLGQHYAYVFNDWVAAEPTASAGSGGNNIGENA